MMLLLVLEPNDDPQLFCILCGLDHCELRMTTPLRAALAFHERCAQAQNARSSRT